MSNQLRVDLSSPVPPFEQIRAGVAGLIRQGHLAPGTRLPTVRSLAADLGVANGTVARAYRELEAAGLVTGEGRRGTAVAAAPPPVTVSPDPRATTRPGAMNTASHQDIPSDLAAAVAAVAVAARSHGLSADEVSALVRAAYEDVPAAAAGQT